jgi:hypothetical protein
LSKEVIALSCLKDNRICENLFRHPRRIENDRVVTTQRKRKDG